MKKITTKDITLCGLFTAVISVCSWICIPTAVPFTMQTFAIFCTLGLLGGKLGMISILLYIFLGAVGLPVFSGFSGGAGVLFGATGGYIIGFVFSALVYWTITSLLGKKLPVMIFAMSAGLLVCYAFGTVWYILVYIQNSSVGITAALSMCVLPFVIPDILKIALAALITKRLKKTDI